MNTPFNTPPGDDHRHGGPDFGPGRPGEFGFGHGFEPRGGFRHGFGRGRGFGPAAPFGFTPEHAEHTDPDCATENAREHHRNARGEHRDHIRSQRGGYGPGFGPGFGGFGPGVGPGFGGGFGGGRGRGRGDRHGRRGAGRRGDVRAAILTLLTEQPMHGYEMIQEIADRSNGLWKPSPGSVYPTLSMLEDEGLIAAVEAHGKKKLFALTDDGREAAANIETAPWTEIAESADPDQVNLRDALGQLFAAVAQSAQAGNTEQQQRILEIVNGARREVYQVLAEG